MLSKIAVLKETAMKILRSFKAVNILVKLVILYGNKLLHRHISRALTRDGADSFIDKLFFKNAYFSEHLSVAMTIKTLKTMNNLIEFDSGNYLYMFSSVFRT